jgi:hypothetical protein
LKSPDNLLNINKRLYSSAIPIYYKIFGYDVVIIKSNLIQENGEYVYDKFRTGYGSLHSSTYSTTSKTIEHKTQIIIPNIRDMANLYNDTETDFTIYHTDKNLLVIGDILKINYNNKLYEYKASSHPKNYYDILYEFSLASMYIGEIN